LLYQFITTLCSLFIYGSCGPSDLHSFPTRRSSDLAAVDRPAYVVEGGARARFELQHLAEEGGHLSPGHGTVGAEVPVVGRITALDRKSTRLNSSHVKISYAVFCLKKKKK